jgi:hypothetical protein
VLNSILSENKSAGLRSAGVYDFFRFNNAFWSQKSDDGIARGRDPTALFSTGFGEKNPDVSVKQDKQDKERRTGFNIL